MTHLARRDEEQFDAGRIVRSPVSLENEQMTGSLGAVAMANASSARGTFDIDGDRRPDAIYQRPFYMNGTDDIGAETFRVWFGSQTGTLGFFRDSTGLGHAWQTPPTQYPDGRLPVRSFNASFLNEHGEPRRRDDESHGMRDVNGDGLVDYVRPDASGQLIAFFNTGSGFELEGTTIADASLATFERTYRWIPDVINQGNPSYSLATIRPLDVDDDGIEDVVTVSEPPTGTDNPFTVPAGAPVGAYMNTGDRLVPVPTATATTKLGTWRNALSRITLTQNDAWRTVSDVMDVNGDGQLDLYEARVTSGCTPTGTSYNYGTCGIAFQVYSAPLRPLRVLKHVALGTGATIAYDYASGIDATAVTTDATHQLAGPIWVVRSATRTSGHRPGRGDQQAAPDDHPLSVRSRAVGARRSRALGRSAAVNACLAASAVVDDASTWTVELAGTTRLAYAETSRRRIATTGTTTETREDATTFTFRDTTSDYQLLPTEVVRRDGAGQVFSDIRYTYDALGQPLLTSELRGGGTFATTQRTYDAEGNVVQFIRPNQYAVLQSGGTPARHLLAYDAFALYVATSTNELGQVESYTHDLANGVLLQTSGPAQGTNMPIERKQIDGLGRIVRRERSFDSGTAYVTAPIYTATYNDVPPRTVVQRSLQSVQPTVWMQPTTTYLDGLDRVIREERPSSAGTAVTTRTYDGAGNVIEVDVPNPAAASPSVYTTQYDGLGRAIRFDGPGMAPVFTGYAGGDVTTQIVPTDGSPTQTKAMHHDANHRLVQVIEGTASPTTTHYTFDANDQMIGVVDADGVATSILYDAGGTRRVVQRGHQSLQYTYDLDGNRTVVYHPTPSGTADPTLYASYSTYDALDRLQSTTSALRSLTSADEKRLFGNGTGTSRTTLYVYDEVGHGAGIGRLTHVELPIGTIHYTYSADGRTTVENRSFTIAPDGVAWTDSSGEHRVYDAQGNVVHVDYPVPGASVDLGYDDRGRPARASIAGASTPLVTLTRNAAGYVTTHAGSGATQTYTYDARGRVASHAVAGGWCTGTTCPTTTIAGETIVFGQDDNVRSVTDAAQGRTIAFGYDERSQLVSATSSPETKDYGAALQYTGAGKIAAARVSSIIAGAEVMTRDVSYDYTPHGLTDRADQAAVRGLVNGGLTTASLAYDPSGNLTEKTVSGGPQSFTYDGDDRLREVVDANTGNSETYYYDHTSAA